MTDHPSLRDVLSQLAAEVQTVSLSERVATSRRRLRRQRAMTATLAAVAVLGGGGFTMQHALSGTSSPPGLKVGGASTHADNPPLAPTPGTLVTCCVGSGIPVPADPTLVTGLSTSSSVPSRPAVTSTSPATPDVAPVTPASAGATARPPSATPPEAVPAGHSCASPWTDESSGQGSPFASSAQRDQASSMGAALCGHLGKANVRQLVEWISMRGLNNVAEGVTYDIQASGPGTTVYLEVFHRSETSTGSVPVITTESGALRAQWPDGTVVLMTKGEDTASNRKIVADPAFDAFRS